MAALTPVAANLHLYQGAIVDVVQVGEAVAAGQAVYKKAADSKYWLADDDAEATADAKGIAVCAGDAADVYIVILKKGGIDLGDAVDYTVGTSYYVGESGGIYEESDLVAGEYMTLIGHTTTTRRLEVDIDALGVAHG